MSLDIYLYTPYSCPHCGGALRDGDEHHSQNYTHNVTPMWSKAGVYEALYESDGQKVTPEYIETLRRGIKVFEENFSDFEKLNPSNGWGSASSALPWLEEWTRSCQRHIGATIRVSR